MQVRVVSRRRGGTPPTRGKRVVYVGRPTRYGNPFEIGVDGSRDAVIRKFEEWLKEHMWLVDELAAEEPEELECWCAPLRCHADVYKRLLAERK